MRRLAILIGFVAIAVGAAVLPAEEPAEAQANCYTQTGFCISNTFIGYFNARGDVETFGYPISREFTFLGFRVQFFQGHILQLQPNGSVATMNLLDAGLMPVSRVNGSTFPAPNQALINQTPPVTDLPGLLNFIQAHAPESFNGQPTRFWTTFVTTVPSAALAGTDPQLAPGFNLEIWGSVTSEPQVEPTNADFIYQRFQRSIMHFRGVCQCTERILLADWFKTVIIGTAPSDLAEEMAGTPFINQWNPAGERWMNRPSELSTTDMTNAFVPELPGFPTPPAAAQVGPGPGPAPAPNTCYGLTPTITGSGSISGTSGDDVIMGSSSDDDIEGRDGNDTICAGDGDDDVDGGDGEDQISGGAGRDILRGGNNRDRIDGGDGQDEIHGESGEDELNGEGGDDDITGGSGNDRIAGGGGEDELNGEAGDDDITGDDGDDTINGGDGDDDVNGGEDDDTIAGDAGRDTLEGDDGNDNINGGADDDTLEGGNGNDDLDGGPGTDTCDEGGGNNNTSVNCEA
jgi:hypothetical protein